MEEHDREVSWKSPTLKKGQYMMHDSSGVTMVVEHPDRTVDPYLASVMNKGVTVYTGLHPTLADARRTCEDVKRNL